MRAYVGVDVGGTFTDVVLAGGDGRTVVRKVLTTHEDPRVGVAEGLRLVLDDAGVGPGDVARVVHGTTLATNVILERKGGRIAFLTTEGFGDMLRLGREARVEDDRYDLFFTTPAPPVTHELTFEVAERLTAAGDVRVALTPEHAAEVAARVAAAAPDAVAICFLHAYADRSHEDLMAAACRDALGDAFVVTSAEVWPEIREYERAMTTFMCAYVGPVMAAYLDGLEARLAELGVRCPIEVMESSGGVMSARLAARRPVYTVESGGAAGVIAAGLVGRLLDADEVISFDMGGTTAKAGIVREGRPDVTHDFQVGGKGSFGGTRPGTGFPVKIPVVDLAEVGAGGGSIAWVDAGGALRVGPRSAGSVPGPACYGRGGTEPTVTDANLVLGYLNPAGLAGGVELSVDAAERALRDGVAGPLGLDVAAAARGVHEIVNANMAAAIRVVTVQRGIDPRGFTLVGFGGAGPMHVARLAATFGITRVAVPWAAGVASAVGLVGSDLGVDRVRTRVIDLGAAGPPEDVAALVESIYAELEAECRAELGAGGRTTVTRSLDARYRGQAHQLGMPAGDGPLEPADLGALPKRFREHYHRTYGIDLDAPVQLVNFRVRVTRLVEKPPSVPAPVVGGPVDPLPALVGERSAHFAEAGGFVTVPVYGWPDLPVGAELAGPAIVEGRDTTIVVPPGHRASVDRWRNVLLARS
jgi:N-methylhydantoinase A